jgi:hypothetical protein
MARYDSGFREPPWVMGSPKEVMEWMDATHPKKKEDKHTFEKKYLDNLHIKFDFDVEKRIIKSPCLVCRMAGLFAKVEEDFEPFPTAELILRGLAKAKFRNTVKIVVDKKILYDHPERTSDLRKTIESIYEFKSDIEKGTNIEIDAILEDVETCLVSIKIKKIHSVKEHTIDIHFNGKIRSEIYHTFFNYLQEKIGLKEEGL